MSLNRFAEILEERETRLETSRIRASTLNTAETSKEREMRLKKIRIRVSTSRAVHTLEDREIVKLNARGRLYQELESISRKRHFITKKISITESITMLSLVKCLPCAYIVMLRNFRNKHLAYVVQCQSQFVTSIQV